MNVNVGSRWSSPDGKEFLVLAVTEQEGHTWIHYRDNFGSSNREYSCYQESFLSRLTKLPE